MTDTNFASQNRRQFLVNSGSVAISAAALNLAAIGQAAAFNANDYKALVCIFLAGGNDQENTVVNYDTASYQSYKAIRGPIALDRTTLLPLSGNPANDSTRQYALHPQMRGLQQVYAGGKAAVVLNVGPLVTPLNKAQYLDRSGKYPVPPQLFSHNDQGSVWLTGNPEGATVGWGGRFGDLALNGNGSASTYTCMSMSGNTEFLAGLSAVMYQGSASTGAVQISAAAPGQGPFRSASVNAAVAQLIQKPSSHILENEYSKVTKRALAAEAAVKKAIAVPAANNPRSNANFKPFDDAIASGSELAASLEMVARIIAGRSSLGVNRQVFFVAAGGYDLHDNLIAGQSRNMKDLSNSLAAFYETTKLLGIDGNVTAFTASDFGRTLSSNGDGSDHGWGAHHFVVGGAVDGGKFYGYAPPVSVGNTQADVDAWHVGQGRLLPTTSVDQYAGTLAKWFGVEDAELGAIFPNLKNFQGQTQSGIAYPRTLSFMKTA
jgi:uncharacterized protein (DUF1501 family)